MQKSEVMCRFILLLLVVVQTSCTSLPPHSEVVQQGFSQEPAPQLKPELTTSQTLSGLAGAAKHVPPLAQTAAKETRFAISAKEVPARNFFLNLVAVSDTNIVVHPKIEGEITISLKDVTIAEVMELVKNVYGYEYRHTPSGYVVLPGGELQSSTFQIDYLNLSRKGISKTRISSGQVTRSGGTQESGVGVPSVSQGASESVSGSVIDTDSSSDFWQELEKALKAIVGTALGRQVVVYPQGNLVVVRALPQELSQVETYLKVLQGNIKRQVIIEAKILEVTLRDGFQSGINWSALPTVGSGTASITQTGGGTLINQGRSEIAGKGGVLDPSNPQAVTSTLTSAFGGAFAAGLQYRNFTAFIELLQNQGDVEVLSSPRISTVNNQKAVIKVGDDEYFVTDVSSDTVTGTTSNTSSDISLTPFFSGIALDVTPQIDTNGMVILHIHPTVSEVVDQQKVVTVGDRTQVLPLAFSSVRESDSIVRAASGQVVVIGGLMKNNKEKKVAGVPVLGDLPLLGPLFRHTKTESIKSELVILVRPIVVDDDAGWEMVHQQGRERFDLLRASDQFLRHDPKGRL